LAILFLVYKETTLRTIQISFCEILKKVVALESIAEELAVEWLHGRI